MELKEKYDAYGMSGNPCGIGENFNANKTCIVNFTIPQDMDPPVLIYYELTNFHQNHRNYYTSRDPFQLLGRVEGQDRTSETDCDPMNKLGNMTLNPCGLIANTFFNDYFTLLSGNGPDGDPLVMIEDGIAWESDLEYLFDHPLGFRAETCPNATDCSDDCCDDDQDGREWSCEKPYYNKKDEKCYRYHYPNDESTQYLHETYPDIVSPLEGVNNEHFVVWMRIAAQPSFRKLYAWINQPIPKGEVLSFQINANYVVTRFGGSKSLIVSTTSIFGGRNNFLAPLFIGVGIVSLVAGAFFALKHFARPRKLGDTKYLSYKED